MGTKYFLLAAFIGIQSASAAEVLQTDVETPQQQTFTPSLSYITDTMGAFQGGTEHKANFLGSLTLGIELNPERTLH